MRPKCPVGLLKIEGLSGVALTHVIVGLLLNWSFCFLSKPINGIKEANEGCCFVSTTADLVVVTAAFVAAIVVVSFDNKRK